MFINRTILGPFSHFIVTLAYICTLLSIFLVALIHSFSYTDLTLLLILFFIPIDSKNVVIILVLSFGCPCLQPLRAPAHLLHSKNKLLVFTMNSTLQDTALARQIRFLPALIFQSDGGNRIKEIECTVLSG